MAVAQTAVTRVDVDELYTALAQPLERIVRRGVQAPDQVIEEACQFAWERLVVHRSRVRRDGALAWLVKTAVREALKLVRRSRRDLSLEAEIEIGGADERSDLRPGPDEVYDRRERLSRLGALSARQQRLLWLYALGLSYEEIAAQAGCSRRTVERQLQRARATLRMLDAG